ncbi:hypothetical protein AB0K00_13960 [Dactylosporangium sp. NPDC049525]|uniref:hypothetical protein n=1 Tax=Dactylosporangium sp. NPDC049525 TaxID=3154730 RepID=UPI00343C7EA6
MRLGLVYVVTAGLAVAAATVSATEVSLRCAAVAFGVLAWQVATGAAAPRLRWPLAAGCVLSAAAALVRQATYAHPPDDVGWFAYGPPGTAALVAMRDTTCWWLGRGLVAAGVQLGAVVLFTGAVYALPPVHRRARIVSTVVVAVVIAAGAGADRWFGTEPWRVGSALCTLWPGLLATAAGLTGLILAGRRADHRWLVAAGAALVATAAAVTLSDLTGLWLTAWSLADLASSEPQAGVALSVAVGEPGAPELTAALTTAATLCGPALLAHGVLRAAPRVEA